MKIELKVINVNEGCHLFGLFYFKEVFCVCLVHSKSSVFGRLLGLVFVKQGKHLADDLLDDVLAFFYSL